MKHVLSFFHITLVVGLLCCGSLVGYATASSGNNDGDEFTSPDSITVATDKSVYTPGEAIEVSITYWNTSESADTLTAVGCFTGFCIDTLEYSPNCTSWFWSCLPVITT